MKGRLCFLPFGADELSYPRHTTGCSIFSQQATITMLIPWTDKTAEVIHQGWEP